MVPPSRPASRSRWSGSSQAGDAGGTGGRKCRSGAAERDICVDFPFANFTPGIAGDTPDFPNKGILLVDFIFQTGSAIGGNEFAIKKFETVDPATASAFACPIVVPPFGS